MPAGELFIKYHDGINPVNGSVTDGWVDAYKQWGLLFSDTALSALMTPPPAKNPIENKSRLEHGKQVVSDSALARKDEREVSLEMYITAPTKEEFWQRYGRFCKEVLGHGFLTIRSKYIEDMVFNMIYMNCTQFSEYMQHMAKFTLRLNEPNPANRT